MECRAPIHGYMSRDRTSNGKQYFVTNPRDGFIDQPMTVPCGQCAACKINHSIAWSLRCVHEASLYNYGLNNIFATLTFKDNPITLVPKYMTDFLKRLRDKNPNQKIRYFQCGEYGTVCKMCKKPRYINGMKENTYCKCKQFIKDLGRPHHHILLFNYTPKDLIPHHRSKKTGEMLYTSKTLEDTWGHGHVTIGWVTYKSAAYTARYVLKRFRNAKKPELVKQHYLYEEYNLETGEITKTLDRHPEYVTMSRGGRCPEGTNLGGIGKKWFDKYGENVYTRDTIWKEGFQLKPPRYYDNLYEEHHSIHLKQIKSRRKEAYEQRKKDNDGYREWKKQTDILQRKLKKLERNLDEC